MNKRQIWIKNKYVRNHKITLLKIHLPCSFFLPFSYLFLFQPFPPSLLPFPLSPLQFIPPFSSARHSSGTDQGPKSELTLAFCQHLHGSAAIVSFQEGTLVFFFFFNFFSFSFFSPWSLKKVTLGLVCMFSWILSFCFPLGWADGIRRPALRRALSFQRRREAVGNVLGS